jgi:epoxide hydrolase
MTDTAVRPFRIEIPQADLDDLAVRLPGPLGQRAPLDPAGPRTGPPPRLGARRPLGYVQDLVSHWRHHYDWRAWEANLNHHPSSPPPSTAKPSTSPTSARPSPTPWR